MHRIFRILGLMPMILAGSAGGSTSTRPRSSDTSVVIPVERLQFYQNKEGFTVANGWSDPTTGPHSNFIKMPAGAKSGLHTHSFSYYGVVVAGVITNEASDDAAARPLKAGSFWFQKGGEPHVTNCLSAVECLIFVTSNGPFDFQKVTKPSSSGSPWSGG